MSEDMKDFWQTIGMMVAVVGVPMVMISLMIWFLSVVLPSEC